MVSINFFSEIERKWQERWGEAKVFEVKEDKEKEKYYVLEMFPYPSGSGLHMGHALNYTIGDIHARFKRMKGFNVLYPMGYDAFGLPAENAAIKEKTHPKKYTENAIDNFVRQQKSLGLSYDWTKMIRTCDSEYYRWNQFFFLKFFEKGLAYRKKAAVNYCKKCNTVLANEQVHNGKCWRHPGVDVEIKHLEQWFLKITGYADELLEDIRKLEWPERIKIMQENWIGKSYGTNIFFDVENKNINCVVVHGCYSRKEDFIDIRKADSKHWISWIRKELKSRGIKVESPVMPESWNPSYEKWKKEFEKVGINENSVLVGHSCGCSFLVRWLGETKRRIRKLILVAPAKIPSEKSSEGIRKMYDFEIDRGIKERINDIVIFVSDNDEKRHKDSAKLFSEVLNGEVFELKGKGHFFYESMRGREFPELLEKIILEKWPIFTTRADTIYGVTFMVISAQHPRLMELITKECKKEVLNFLKRLKSTSEKEAKELDKEGVFTGSYAINPANGWRIPIYAGNFVVADYGSGMVMAVPAHDQRDFEFAKKYKIPIKVVINPPNFDLNADRMSRAYTGDGRLVNSGEFDGWNNREAIEEIVKILEKKKLGKKTVNYKLRDWLISRQRYWGTPIPIVYCENCGVVPVPYEELPVLLPEKVRFGEGNPLASQKEFVETFCPKCNAKAKRETDTMDTFFDSSWYFLRYCDNKNNKEAFDKKKVNYWMPVDQYIGGAEHACMHLIYARFFTKLLRDLNYLDFDEPFLKLFNQGMLHGEDGHVMSKSRGNVVLPEEVSKKYGIDSARLFLVSVASPDKDVQWSEKGIVGSYKFILKLFDFFSKINFGKSSQRFESKINKFVKEVTEDIETFRYNLAVIKIRDVFDRMSEEKEVSKKDVENFLKILSVFCPHVSEELWERIGNKSFVSIEKWPVAEESKINEWFEKEEKALEDLMADIRNILNILGKKGEAKSRVSVFAIPGEVELYRGAKDKIKKVFDLDAEIFSVQDAKKAGKVIKAKPGKPGILIE